MPQSVPMTKKTICLYYALFAVASSIGKMTPIPSNKYTENPIASDQVTVLMSYSCLSLDPSLLILTMPLMKIEIIVPKIMKSAKIMPGAKTSILRIKHKPENIKN